MAAPVEEDTDLRVFQCPINVKLVFEFDQHLERWTVAVLHPEDGLIWEALGPFPSPKTRDRTHNLPASE